MKKILLIGLLVVLIITGCLLSLRESKDAKVVEFALQLSRLNIELAEVIKNPPTLETVKEAKRIVEARKENLIANCKKLRSFDGMKVNSATAHKFSAEIDNTFEQIKMIYLNHLSETDKIWKKYNQAQKKAELDYWLRALKKSVTLLEEIDKLEASLSTIFKNFDKIETGGFKNEKNK